MPSTLSRAEAVELARLITKVVEDDNGFIPDEAYIPVHRLVPWSAVEVALVNDAGSILLEHRKFDIWPATMSKKLGKMWNEIKGWYVPGGYIKPEQSFENACREHLIKDGIMADFEFLGVAGVDRWMIGDHPFGTPISIVCICKVVGGKVKYRNTKDGMWQNQPSPEKFMWTHPFPIPTEVPHHEEIQRIAFRWIAGHPEYFRRK